MARLVTLQVFLEPADALVVRSLLEAQGFYVYCADDICRLDWLHAPAYGGARIQVLDIELEHIVSFLGGQGWQDGQGQDMRMPFARSYGAFGPFSPVLMLMCIAVGLVLAGTPPLLAGLALIFLRNVRKEPGVTGD